MRVHVCVCARVCVRDCVRVHVLVIVRLRLRARVCLYACVHIDFYCLLLFSLFSISNSSSNAINKRQSTIML